MIRHTERIHREATDFETNQSSLVVESEPVVTGLTMVRV